MMFLSHCSTEGKGRCDWQLYLVQNKMWLGDTGNRSWLNVIPVVGHKTDSNFWLSFSVLFGQHMQKELDTNIIKLLFLFRMKKSQDEIKDDTQNWIFFNNANKQEMGKQGFYKAII